MAQLQIAGTGRTSDVEQRQAEVDQLKAQLDGAKWNLWCGAHFMGIVLHTDAEREYAYDRRSRIGKLDKALDEGTKRG